MVDNENFVLEMSEVLNQNLNNQITYHNPIDFDMKFAAIFKLDQKF